MFGEMFDQEFNFIWIQGSSRLNLKLMTSKSIRLRLDIQNRFGEIFVQEFNLIWTQRYLRLYFENVWREFKSKALRGLILDEWFYLKGCFRLNLRKQILSLLSWFNQIGESFDPKVFEILSWIDILHFRTNIMLFRIFEFLERRFLRILKKMSNFQIFSSNLDLLTFKLNLIN